MKTITFIGAGKMAEAILKGLLGKQLLRPKDVTLTDISAERLAYLAKTYQVKTSISNIQAVSSAEIIIIAVKPQAIGSVLEELRATANKNQLIISIAAGITINQIDPQDQFKIARVMPNTGAVVQESATAIAYNKNINSKEKETIHSIFSAIGTALEVPEEMLDAVTGLSGSGPAFIFRLMEAFLEAGRQLDLPEDITRKLTFQTFKGSAVLAQNSGKELSELIDQVTSPNGTTAAGRKILEKSDIKEVLIQTIIRAKNRADELSRGEK